MFNINEKVIIDNVRERSNNLYYGEDMDYVLNLIHNVINGTDKVKDLVLISTDRYDIIMTNDNDGLHISSIGSVPDSEPLKIYKGIWS
jgi:hypothetical protein